MILKWNAVLLVALAMCMCVLIQNMILVEAGDRGGPNGSSGTGGHVSRTDLVRHMQPPQYIRRFLE